MEARLEHKRNKGKDSKKEMIRPELSQVDLGANFTPKKETEIKNRDLSPAENEVSWKPKLAAKQSPHTIYQLGKFSKTGSTKILG